MRPTHIIIINIYFAPYTFGGATIVAEQVGHALKQKHGYKISTISAISRHDLQAYKVIKVEKDGIPNYLINLPHGRPYSETYDNPRVTEAISNILETLDPDLVHIHCIQDLGIGAISAAKYHELPIVLSTHDFWWICERQFLIRMEGHSCHQDPINIDGCRGCVGNLDQARTRQKALRNAAAQADLITFPSHFAYDLNKRSGIVAKQNLVWSNGTCPPGPDFFERQKSRRQQKPHLSFGFVGGPSQIKGWPTIRKAFEGLSRDNFEVYLVDASLYKGWWKRFDAQSLPGTWHIHPRFKQSEMDAFYSKIDVILFPSQWRETFGLTIREALSRGIRVIQTNGGGTIEHPLADPHHMIEIGANPRMLRTELEYVLDRPQDHPSPIAVAGFDDQADEIAAVFKKLIKTPV